MLPAMEEVWIDQTSKRRGLGDGVQPDPDCE